MHGEARFGRFFAYLNLFVASMLTLVLADNFGVLFLGWELVGLCSYLLISFWFEKPVAAAAGNKAFVVNRIGDFGFMVALMIVFATFGTLSFGEVLEDPGGCSPPGRRPRSALLLLVAAAGKSAQIPLYVWLPDAMEGPTPVSALIHAATMVTAGVYLVARTAPIFSPWPRSSATVAPSSAPPPPCSPPPSPSPRTTSSGCSPTPPSANSATWSWRWGSPATPPASSIS